VIHYRDPQNGQKEEPKGGWVYIDKILKKKVGSINEEEEFN